MCLILFAHHAHPRYPLVLAANRDEAYHRPAARAAFWKDHPDIYGGRDLDRGGTWLAIARSGRIAAVTNFRNAHAARDAPRSRGDLVKDYLTSDVDARAYLESVEKRGAQYNGFIVIAGNLDALYWLSNRGAGVAPIAPGVHGLSNHLLNTPWPKIQRSKRALEALIDAREEALIRGLFDILADRSLAADSELPDTGVGLQRERELSANFISGEHYGTRASTVVLIGGEGAVHFIERSFGRHGEPLGETANHFNLKLPDRPAPAGFR
ncbi:MAG TPA: NRDE family protein [Burkholderiales bacterium]|nr:NRDE family protein [Burkholderiales bacterium]